MARDRLLVLLVVLDVTTSTLNPTDSTELSTWDKAKEYDVLSSIIWGLCRCRTGREGGGGGSDVEPTIAVAATANASTLPNVFMSSQPWFHHFYTFSLNARNVNL